MERRRLVDIGWGSRVEMEDYFMSVTKVSKPGRKVREDINDEIAEILIERYLSWYFIKLHRLKSAYFLKYHNLRRGILTISFY